MQKEDILLFSIKDIYDFFNPSWASSLQQKQGFLPLYSLVWDSEKTRFTAEPSITVFQHPANFRRFLLTDNFSGDH